MLLDHASSLRQKVFALLEHALPAIPWGMHWPHLPHGVMGLWATLRLEPIMTPAAFETLLAQSCLLLEKEATGSQGFDFGPCESLPYANLMEQAAPDMANVGHKAVLLHSLEHLSQWFAPHQSPAVLQHLAHWTARQTPMDLYWHQRMKRRLATQTLSPGLNAPPLSQWDWATSAQILCQGSMLQALDEMTRHLHQSTRPQDLLAILTLAACEKQLHADPPLEGKTAWNVVYLEALTGRLGQCPAAWGQAAALIQFFPGEPSTPLRCLALHEAMTQRASTASPDTAAQALEAALGEQAMGDALAHASALLAAPHHTVWFRTLAHSLAQRNMALDRQHSLLALAAGVALHPHLPFLLQAILLSILTKMLANTTGQ